MAAWYVMTREDWYQLLIALPAEGVKRHFDTEDKCIERLATVRWPAGVFCSSCGAKDVGRIKTRKSYQCRECRHQFTVTSETILHRTHLDLATWFIAAELMITAYERDRAQDLLTSEKLKTKLKVTYKVAYDLRRKLNADLAHPSGGLIGRCICVGSGSV